MVKALPKAFWIALLLTGNIEAAEAAVLDGIATLELDHISGDTLLLATTNSAIQPRTESVRQPEGLSILPLELRRLFLLTPNCRDRFVLRVFIGLTPEICSGILQLSIHDVEDAFYAALQGLSRIDTCEIDRYESVNPDQDAMVDLCTSVPGVNTWLLTQ
jgi:hypothetical protein